MTTKLTDTFSAPASDLIKLMAWLQGKEFGLTLMLKCYSISKADRINRATVERALELMTIEFDAAAK